MRGLKQICGMGDTAEEVAEKAVEDEESSPQALKRGHIFNGLAARLKSGPSQNLPESDCFRSLGGRGFLKSALSPCREPPEIRVISPHFGSARRIVRRRCEQST